MDDEENSNRWVDTRSSAGRNNVECSEKTDHDGTENNDSVMAPTTELSTSLSCSSADICEQSPSNCDSGFDMASNVNEKAGAGSLQAEENSNMAGTKTGIASIEPTSGKTAKLFSRKSYKSRNYRNRATFVSSSDDEDAAENKVKHAKTGDTSTYVSSDLTTLTGEQASVGTIFCENASSSQKVGSFANQNEHSEIAFENISTSHNVRVIAGAECSNRLEEFELSTTAAPSSANEEDTAIRADENDTPPANRRSDRGNRLFGRIYRIRTPYDSSTWSSSEDESAVEGDGSTPRPSSEHADLVVSDNVPSEGSDISFIASPDSLNAFNRLLYSSSSNDSDDSDTEEAMLDSMSDTEQSKILQDVLNKPKPTYTWNSTNELRRREHGLCGWTGRYSLRNGFSFGFNSRFYSSRHVVERMKFSHQLREHTGCVNCLNFNRSGDLLCTGSDDTKVVVWDWAHNKIKLSYKSGHTANIFQTKFLEGSNCQGLDIITTGRDREIRHAVIPPSGGDVKTTCLYRHKGPVHKLVICPRSPQEIISVGEDGFIRQYDLRKKTSILLQIIKIDERRLRLFGISHHPFKPEIVVCGCDRFVRVFDTRHMNEAIYEMCPKHLIETSLPQVTCCVYNSTGSEVLASYSDDHIYLFNNRAYQKGEYLHQYRGHYNNKTIKGVNFFGPNSEFIISGSDCGNIFFWDKNTESILNCMPGDTMGVVNCLETHPSVPILATSGLDPNVKIWAPTSESYPPDLSKLSDRVRRNLKRSVTEEGTAVENRQFHYFIRQLLGQSGGVVASRPQFQNVPPERPTSSSSDEADYPQLDHVNCRTQ